MSVPLSSSFQCLKLAISVTRTKQKTLSGQDGLESIIDFAHLMQQIYEFIFITERNLEENFCSYHIIRLHIHDVVSFVLIFCNMVI